MAKIHFSHSFSFDPKGPCYRPDHGPKDWDTRPWYKPLAFLGCKLSVHAPSTGYRLWIYTKYGSMDFDIYFDRRKKNA